MKIFIMISILLVCSLIGYQVKNKYVLQKEFLNYIKSFVEYYELNVSIFKNNIVEIINNYLIMQNNKNAKFDKLFEKNNNLQQFNKKLCKTYICDSDIIFAINSYFNNIGKSDLKNESEKNKNFLNLLNFWTAESDKEIKDKGELYFKLWLTLGVVVCIVLW